MNIHLQHILDTLLQIEAISDEQKSALNKSLKDADKELTILEFKLDRTEKVKRTTAILLEETIEELELKRKAVEESNEALQKTLEDLKAAQAQLIQQEKLASLGQLTAGIAHEIQNPLNFVNNFSELSTDLIEEMREELAAGNGQAAEEIAEDLKANLSKINHHGKRADAIVKSMLEHSKTGTGQKELTDINKLISEITQLAYRNHQAKDQSLEVNLNFMLDPGLPQVEVIPSDLGKVILNLVNNALYACGEKATLLQTQGDGGYKPEIIVSTNKTSSGIEISIKDNGIGIPEAIKDKIFQPFFTTKPTGSGTGLGLSLSYDIVKAHGGELGLESKEGEGSIFRVILQG
ncbi:phospho-acceptor domain-containing protein [Algoriphagus boseongensis]|uniref:histidine kinase n=1 Tax=Algoriphagus boseongensis TaxID=1442587 RepID=A0A4R6T7X2_9BACT|nr:ATP-binding protein [Algoriphagus boseongensis]TDQ17038.1 phospho-acceptor domain-containing protein [Algoriphagus boseongensis]